MHVIDLSHTMQTGMPVYPGDEPVNVRRTRYVNRDGFALTAVSYGSHAGTHVDTSAHFFADAPTLDWLGPDNFTGWGAVVDLSSLDGTTIDQRHLARLGSVEALDFVLLRTGWDRHWKTDTYYTGRFPVLTDTACRFLGGLELKGVGMDTPSPDPLDSRDFSAHQTLLNYGMVIVENLTCLGDLPEEGFVFSCLPLKIRDGEGSPCRAVGMTF